MEQSSKGAAYTGIALDMARRIAQDEFQEGQKLSGRTALASEYAASPETIRKAMRLLQNMQVLQVKHGSGIYIRSKENAKEYLASQKNLHTLRELEDKLADLLTEKQAIDARILHYISEMSTQLNRMRNADPIRPFKVFIHDGCRIVGQTIAELSFWQQTGGTIIGVQHDQQEMLLSPGPDYVIRSQDTLVVVGDFDVIERTHRYLDISTK